MRYLVTGAGMLGRALEARLRDAGHEVVLVDAVAGDRVTVADLRDGPALRDALVGVDGVFHTAAVHGFREATDAEFFDVNVAGTWTLLDAMAATGVSRLVHASTIGVYGSGRPRVIGPETAAVPGRTPYDESKRLAEEVVRFWADHHGVVAVCLRYGAFRELLERTFGTVSQEWAESGAVVLLDDLVAATVAAMELLPLPRAAYVVAPTATGTAYAVDASATEADLGVRLRREADDPA